jgi:hypothetical protein
VVVKCNTTIFPTAFDGDTSRNIFRYYYDAMLNSHFNIAELCYTIIENSNARSSLDQSIEFLLHLKRLYSSYLFLFSSDSLSKCVSTGSRTSSPSRGGVGGVGVGVSRTGSPLAFLFLCCLWPFIAS